MRGTTPDYPEANPPGYWYYLTTTTGCKNAFVRHETVLNRNRSHKVRSFNAWIGDMMEGFHVHTLFRKGTNHGEQPTFHMFMQQYKRYCHPMEMPL